MENKLLDLKSNLVFQKLFGKQENSEITIHFLSLILGRKVQNIDLDVNKRMLSKRKNSKTGRLDVRAKFNDGEDCNIELQVIAYEYMPERMLEYWSRMYDNKINSGDGYNVLKPSIAILIANYKLKETEKVENYHTIWNLRETHCRDIILTKNIEMHILEIPKIKANEMAKDELLQWLKFIEDSENEEVRKFMSENKYLEQAKKELEYLSGDPSFQAEVEARAGMLRDIYSMNYKNREDGKKEGKKEAEHRIAKKMKAKNMPIGEISELTGLSEEEIKKL